jgi:hypothetical protein
MSENEIKIPGSHIIINGGDPVNDCPTDWKTIPALEEKLNEGKDVYDEPQWKFDCGFKLDFDGALLRISSRFYPPKTSYGPTWDGSVSTYFLDEEIEVKAFDCPTLPELVEQVEAYVKEKIQEYKDKLTK